MRLCHRAGYIVPLLTITAVLAGCATSTTEPPANFNSSPQVVAIYAVDSAFGSLPDVLIYSTAPGDQGKISTNPPPSYGSYRVEFDQPINGATVANNADRGTGPTPGGAASFCSPLSTNPIQLVDVDAANRVVTSSVCYDATSPLGEHPHVLVIPGRDALNTPTAPALTCNTFRADPGLGPGGNVFTPNHKYGIKVNAATIQNGGGKPLAAPTTGWTGDTFQFTTSGQKILAAGFQDANTGFFVWLDKPEPGFEKDLAPCATTRTCPDAAGNNTLATFQKPADSSPFLVVLTEPITDPTNDLANFADLSSVVTLVRADDGSDPEHGATTGLPAALGGLVADPRVIEVLTGDTFEPGQTYTLTVPAGAGGIVADSGDPLPTTATYTFATQPGTPARLSTAPANGAQAQGHANVAVSVAHNDVRGNPAPADAVAVAAITRPSIEFSSPIAGTEGGAPTGTFTLTGPSGAVGATPQLRAGFNQQVVRLTPTVPLVPETIYTVSWTGVKAAAQPKAFAGQAFPDGSSQFTTATFRMAILDDPKFDTATSNTNIGRNGFAFPGVTVVAVNLDRRVDVEPAHLKSGDLHVLFNNAAAGVSTSSLVISELAGTANTSTPIANFTVAPTTAGDTTNFTVTLPASYQPKFGQKYEVRAKTTITNPTTGKALKAEGAGGDDVKSFTTRPVTATVSANPASTTATGFKVTFSDAMDPASITPFLGTEFKLFERVNGALNTTPVPISCTITSPTVVTCTATGGLGTAPRTYLASAVFLQTAAAGQGGPAIVSPAVSTDQSARFFGSVSANIFAPCQ